MSMRGVTFSDDGTVLGERELGPGNWVRFQADLALLWIQHASDVSAAAGESIWALQDGYGAVGYTPPQGWDWSGIRDSSPAAIAAMLSVAREYLPDEDFARTLGADPAVLTRLATLYR